MSLHVKYFVANRGLTKPLLKQAPDKIGLDYDTSVKNVELQQILVDHFVEEDFTSLPTGNRLTVRLNQGMKHMNSRGVKNAGSDEGVT